MAGFVIQATRAVEIEDGLRAGPRHLAEDQFLAPLAVQVGPRGGVVVIGTLLSDQIPILLSSTHRWC